MKVFVSYKRVDKNKVIPIIRQLESRLGIRFWIDLEGIKSDEQFSNVIVNAINQCEVFLFMFSKNHENVNPKKDWTVREITFADKKGKRIIFVALDDHELPDWFAFRFPDQQVVPSGNSLAMEKLTEDLRRWLVPANVKPAENKSYPIGMTAIDLGLASGTKWASCNVGANKPEEYGIYLAYGETEEKDVYDESTYIYNSSDENVLAENISGTKYDVAQIRCGKEWQMPSIEQITELLNNCYYEVTTVNGVRGGLFTSKINGNNIFIPFSGFRKGTKLGKKGSYTGCWSGTRYPDNNGTAYGLYIIDVNAYWHFSDKCYGFTVRPVTK